MLAIGENSWDRVGRVAALPAVGGKTALLDYAEYPGGQIATAALACAQLGLRVSYVGSVGDDAAGAAALAPLERAGIDLSGVRRVRGAATRTALILVDEASGERTVLWHRDPALALRPAELRRDAIEAAGALLLDACDVEAASWAAGVARDAGVPVVLDVDAPAPGLEALLARVDFPIVSQGFAEAFCHGTSVREVLAELLDRGARLAVVTLGDRGSLAAGPAGAIETPAFPVKALDTTGAGDVFHAAFTWALLGACTAPEALRAANAAAALACTAPGAQGFAPGRGELERLLGASAAGVREDAS